MCLGRLGNLHRPHARRWTGSARGVSLVLAALALGTLVLLAGCGQLVAGGVGARVATATPSPGTPATLAASTLNGCPVKQAPADAAAFAPDVIIRPETGSQTDSAGPITLARGQHLEIRLAPEVQWRLSSADPDHALAATSAEGWYSPSVNACVWRFAASSAGSAQLVFNGIVACQPAHLRCVAVAERATVGVSVR